MVFTGYHFAIGLFRVFGGSLGVLERWELIQKLERNIFLSIELQWILSGIVFSFAAIYLIQDIFHEKSLKNKLL